MMLNGAAKVSARQLGTSQSTLLIIDDALLNADTIREYACTHGRFDTPEATQYPGLNATLPVSFMTPLAAALRPLLAPAFGVPLQQAVTCHGYFGLVTLPAAALSRVQVIPHVDLIGHQRLAALLYLCDATQGGTAFYCHKASGLERLTGENFGAYKAALDADSAGGDLPCTYVQEDHPCFERIGFADARFNRLVVYNSNLLHSGMVNPALLSPDPRVGRLTMNVFISAA
jgi:hypothetical protein